MVSNIADWQYLISEHFARCLVIGFEPKKIEPLISKLTTNELIVTLIASRRKNKAEQNCLAVTAELSKLPFKNNQFGLIICRNQDQLNIQAIYNSLANKGSIFLLIDRKKNRLTRDRNKIAHYFSNMRSFFAVPSLENPWFIIPADDSNVIRYFILNMMSSRLRRRRLAIMVIRWITALGLHPLLLRFLPWQVIIGNKAGAA